MMAQEQTSLAGMLLTTQSHALSLIDITPFLSDTFNPQEYANDIIEGPSGRSSKQLNGEDSVKETGGSGSNWLSSTGKKDLDVEGDVSVALSRLNLAIDDVDRLIKDEVTTHANDLLNHTTTLLALRPDLTTLTTSLRALQDHQEKLVQRVSIPRSTLTANTIRLSKIRSAQNLVKRAERFVRLVRRLQSQMKILAVSDKKADDRNKLEKLEEIDGEGEVGEVLADDNLLDVELGEQQERGLSRAALTLAEISALIDPQWKFPKQEGKTDRLIGQDESAEGALTDLDLVKELMPSVEEAREKVTDLMEDMVVRGLRDLSPTLLSTSLQSAFNLGQLADLVRDLLADLNEVIRDRVAAAFDMQSLAQEMGTREPILQQPAAYSSYRSKRGAQVDTSVHSAQYQRWSEALWKRLETLLVGEMGAVCSKVYTLERVLTLKTDRMTGRNYLDEAMSVLGDRPSSIFWTTLSQALEKQSRMSTKSSAFLSQALATSYPRLLRLLHEFFDKVAIYAEDVSYSATSQSPEAIKILDSVDHLEGSYLSRTRMRLDQFVASSFSPQRAAGAQEGAAAAKMAEEEIDKARFDPILLRHVTHLVQAWLTTLAKILSEQRGKDASALSLQRSATSPSQLSNAHLTNAAYALRKGLRKLVEEAPAESRASLGSALQNVERLYERDYVDTLLHAIFKEVSDTAARMHYVDFGMREDAVLGGSGGSAYMSDLSDRLWYAREQLLVHYSVEHEKASWIIRIAKHALQSFIINASLIRPLGEGGKLKLTSDMTELEFAVSQLLASAPPPCPTMADCGADFKALRAFRSLIFRDYQSFVFDELLPTHSGLAAYQTAHHIIVRSKSILLPHELHKWTRIEYIKWLDSHTDPTDAMQLIKGCLDARKADESGRDSDGVWIDCLQGWIDHTQLVEGGHR